MAKDNVIILGAGASVEAGGPLMKNFLDIAEDLLAVGKFDSPDDIKQVFKLIADLQPIYSKSYLDLNNIEVLFGVIEMARITGQLGRYSKKEDIERLRESIVRLIVDTIELSVKFELVAGRQRAVPPASYNTMINRLKKSGQLERTSIITFNYDVCVEYALHCNRVPFNYCLDGNPGESLHLLKLHGSINWAKNSENESISIYPIAEYYEKYAFEPVNERRVKVPLRISKAMVESIPKIDKLPIIVPPTWNKTHYHGALANVWSVAAKDLKSAKNIYVLGYSLPESDQFFRYLYATGSIGESRIRRFWVYDPDPKVEGRFKQLLGPSVLDRFDAQRHNFGYAFDSADGPFS